MEHRQSRICVSICERTVDDIKLAATRAAESADLIELRLDCLEQSWGTDSLHEIAAFLSAITVPVIVTYRPAEQGGRRDLNARQRLRFWLFNRPAADFFDVEYDIATTPSVFDSDKHFDWTRAISSYHNFREVPADLMAIYEQMTNTRARILKIAVQADDAIDCLPVFQLLDRGIRAGHQMIAIAMGIPGLPTRILGPSRGAFLTYASPADDKTTAPGQVSVRELREVYRIERINKQTQITGLIAGSVSHSISPAFHNAAFAAAECNAVYIPFEVKDLKSFMERMVHPRTRELDWRMRGLSVTAPHKVAVIDHLDWIDPVAHEIGAVNTIVVEGDELRGYNTDAAGFMNPLLKKCGDLQGWTCAVIGAGGAARAVVWGLRERNVAVSVFARDARRAEKLAEEFGSAWQPLGGASFEGFNIVVNTTPLGTMGQLQSETPVTASQLAGANFAYDIVYNPISTTFLREAESAGCETLSGLEMLVAQAEEQFRLWTGAAAPARVMREAADHALDSRS